MTDSSRRGAANFTPVLMIVAFLAMLGFLWWLGATSEGTGTVVMNEDTTEVADTVGATAQAVTHMDLRQPEQFEGQDVRISGGIAQQVGSRAFFLDLQDNPFLVRYPSGQAAPQGEVEVVGMVRVVNDSLVTAWSEEGSISSGEVPLVQFATHFIDARRVRPAGGAQGGGGN